MGLGRRPLVCWVVRVHARGAGGVRLGGLRTAEFGRLLRTRPDPYPARGFIRLAGYCGGLGWRVDALAARSGRCRRMADPRSDVGRPLVGDAGRVSPFAGTAPLYRSASISAGDVGSSGAARPRSVSPHCEQRVAWMRGRGTSLAARLIPASSETEVLFDDLAAPLVVGVQPAANSLGRKASIRERTDERPSWAQHAGHVSEHFYGSGEVVDRNAAHHGVEGLVGEWQPGLGVEVVDDGDPCRGVRVELVGVHPEHG